MNALPKDPKTRRKLLIYGGLAGALLLIVLLSRRGSEQAGTQPQDPTAVASPAPSDGGGSLGSGSAVDNSAQLADFENALLSQLPEAISSSILAGLGNGVPAPGGGGNMTINIGTTKAGAKKTGHKKAKPHPHPAAGKHHHHKPKPHHKPPRRKGHRPITRNV